VFDTSSDRLCREHSVNPNNFETQSLYVSGLMDASQGVLSWPKYPNLSR
jgi:hypothetical protein